MLSDFVERSALRDLSNNMPVLREKQAFLNILGRYKELPWLWKPSHELYNNKMSRKEGFTELLEMYRLIEPDAQLLDIKKKIENFRTAYKRELVKVLKSRMADGPEYIPTLWYYNDLKFLDEIFDSGTIPEPRRSKTSSYVEEEEEEQEEYTVKTESNCDSPSPPKKKRTYPNLVFLEEDGHDSEKKTYTIGQDYIKDNHEQTSSAESFGRTVGLQLSELPPMQRFIAEKLISDVIFYARLEKLDPGSALHFDKSYDS